MAGGTTVDYNGLFKQAYADQIENLIPEDSQLTRAIKFMGRDKMLGDQYNQPVILRSEQGFTYSPPNNGAFAINGPSSMKMKNAVVNGYQILENCGIDYESVSRSDNVNSFRNAVDLVMEDAAESFGRRLELSLLYGQSATGLGRTTATSTNVSATSTTFAFATGQWSAGLWAPLEGASIHGFNAGGTLVNTNAPLVVSGIDVVNKTLTVTGNATDIAAIDTYLDGTGGRSLTLRFVTVATNEMVGLDAIMLNTGSLFGIDAATYNLWQANTYNAGGTLSLDKIQAGVAIAFARGLSEDVDIYVNPSVWKSLSTEQVAYRMMDSSYSSKDAKNGFEALTFYSQNGKISVKAHKYVKEGDAFMLPTKRAVRVGSSDMTFNIPGTMGGQVFVQDPNNAGFTFRLYAQQSLLIETPARCVKFYGITL